MGKFRYNLALVVANILFGANFSFYVSLTRHYLNFEQVFMLQILAAAAFFIPSALFSRRSYRIPVEDFGNIFIVALMVIYGWMYLLLRSDGRLPHYSFSSRRRHSPGTGRLH